MELVRNFCRNLSHTKILDQCGKWETLFFGSVYRAMYITGQSPWDNSLVYRFYRAFVTLMVAYFILGDAWFFATKARTLDEIVSPLCELTSQGINLYRHWCLVKNKAFFKSLASSMSTSNFDISPEGRRKLVETWAKLSQNFFYLLGVLAYSVFAAWFLLPIVDDVEYNFVASVPVPFNYKTPWRYPFAFLLVWTTFQCAAHFVVLTDGMMQMHLIHHLCQYALLGDCYENIIIDCSEGFEGLTESDLVHNKEFADKFRKRLGNLVDQHKLMLRNTMKLRSIWSGPMLGQLAASSILICFVAFQAATNISVNIFISLRSFLFLGYNVFGLFIICKWCEEITNWSEKLGEAIYSSRWECGIHEINGVRSSIVFIMARASKPVVFTAGGMYDISLKSYASVLKASYSALTVLLRFRH